MVRSSRIFSLCVPTIQHSLDYFRRRRSLRALATNDRVEYPIEDDDCTRCGESTENQVESYGAEERKPTRDPLVDRIGCLAIRQSG